MKEIFASIFILIGPVKFSKVAVSETANSTINIAQPVRVELLMTCSKILFFPINPL